MKGLAAKTIRAPTVLAAALWPLPGHACGACDEDKVAVIYDHAVIQQAATNGNVVVFCEVVGTMELAREMAAYISPRPGFTPHQLTLRAADEMRSLFDRANHFRTTPAA